MRKVTITKSDIAEAVKDVLKENFLHESRPNTYNNAPLVSINETTARRMLDRHSESGYIVVSACRGGADFNLDPEAKPADRQKLAAINNERTKKLEDLIKQSGFSYTPVYGGFIENKGTENEENVYEQSFVIYNKNRQGEDMNFDDLKNFGIQVCKDFNQDSVLVKAQNEPPKYITKNGDVDMEFSGDVAFNDFSQDYFTDLHKNTHKYADDSTRKDTRFSFLEAYVNPKPQCYSERHIRWMNGEVFI